MSTLIILVWGIFGGIIPEIVRIHKILKDGGDFYYSKVLLLFTGLLALCGGVVAVAFDISYSSCTPFIAILFGAATPTIISTASAIISKLLKFVG